MGSQKAYPDGILILSFLVSLFFVHQCLAVDNAHLVVDASGDSGRKVPETLFGIFFEEINHAGTGGLWAELVSNRGFEAGGQNTPSNIDPWFVIGDQSSVLVSTEHTSCFQRNKVALKLQVLCNRKGCPDGGVGIYNPGFWGMDIEEGNTYKLVLYVRSTGAIDLSVSLTDPSGLSNLATAQIVAAASNVSKWTKMEVSLKAVGTNHNSRLQLTTNKKGIIWLDQVSLMPSDTYKGHGLRNQHIEMLQTLKPKFFRFPGGTYVEGIRLRNAFRWNDTVGPWEERSGHLNDVRNYWTDDGLGFYELLQLSEDLGALPVWVFNIGISRNDEVDPTDIFPFVKEALDGMEFARGDPKSKWGSVRAGMGHPEPFDLRYVALGNEDCVRPNYKANYVKFYSAIRQAYPDMQMISNCDGSISPLDHPAELYDFHIYSPANYMFSMAHLFDHKPRGGPKAFVSEYAVTENDAGTGSLLAALAEAGFLIGIETNSDVVSMACYAPLFVNSNDRQWNPSAIVFNSYQIYGTPSYYMQQFFIESSGATLINSSLQSNTSSNVVASAITWQNSDKSKEYLRIKVVNFGNNGMKLKISISGLSPNAVFSGLTKRELTSTNVMDENSFIQPQKVLPKTSPFAGSGQEMTVNLSPNSFTSFDLLKDSNSAQIKRTRAGSKQRHLKDTWRRRLIVTTIVIFMLFD